jgi:D-tyrosyl-tRNA(Tyr) deacylase
MRAVVQRVSKARVVVGEEVVGEIGRGLLVLLGVAVNDTAEQVQWLADKVVGQFTLYGDCRKGRRPSFIEAAQPPLAIPLYEAFCDAVRAHGVPVATGRFGAMMQVELVNDGPVTLIVDSK